MCNADAAIRGKRDCVIEDVGPEWAAVCSCVVVELACMFHVCLCNDTVITLMTVSLAEKDVLYSMAAAGSLMPVYQTTRRRIPETLHKDYPTTAWRCSDSPFCVLCTFPRSHCCTRSPCFMPVCFTPFRSNAPYHFTPLIYALPFSM